MKPRLISFYLPQFYPTPENDEWWGKGFTEWTNVGRAKPLFKGHYQPKVPADLGYYDLRIPEVREQQADLAREAGIEGFCYWHYWFGNGKRLLDRVFREVVETGKPDFPFCLCWANHSWYAKTREQIRRGEKYYRGTFLLWCGCVGGFLMRCYQLLRIKDISRWIVNFYLDCLLLLICQIWKSLKRHGTILQNNTD